MSTENTNTKSSALIKALAVPLLVLFIFFEELLFKPMKKIVIPWIPWLIEISPPWMVITGFVILEILKIALKFLLVPYAFTWGFWYGTVAFLAYLIVSFLTLQIMVHGTQKLRSYKWFNTLYEWVEIQLKPLKKYKDRILEWGKSVRLVRTTKVTIWKMRKNKNTLWGKAVAQAREWKQSLLTWIIAKARKWKDDPKQE